MLEQLKFKLQVISLAITIILTGCGSGGNNQKTSEVTGKFIDDPVQGLTYKCSSGLSDLTNSKGEFTCKIGDNVFFYSLKKSQGV